MVRITISLAIVSTAFSVSGAIATADDKTPARSGFSGGASTTDASTLVGKGTAASAARAADTEMTWYPGYYRGYRRGYYNGFYAGFGAPWVYPYAAAYPYSVGYYAPYYIPPAVGFYGRIGPVALGIGINGAAVDVAAPAVPLGAPGGAALPAAPQPGGNFRYDGGPANPVPLPKQDPNGPNTQAVPVLPPSPGLPVSLPRPAAPAAKPYTYKGYGEK